MASGGIKTRLRSAAARISQPAQADEAPAVTSKTSTASSSSCNFHFFPFLPKELRVEIWQRPLANSRKPRVIQLAYDEKVYDYRVLNRNELKRTGFYTVAHDIAAVCVESRYAIKKYMTDHQRAYHNANLPHLGDIISTSRDIFFIKHVDHWPIDGHGPEIPIFLPLADEEGKWGRFDLMPKFAYDIIPSVWITLSELRDADKRHPGLYMDLLFHLFATRFLWRRVTILLDDPGDGHINPDDWAITPFGPGASLDGYEAALKDDLLEIQEGIQAYQGDGNWDPYQVFCARIKTRDKGCEDVDASQD